MADHNLSTECAGAYNDLKTSVALVERDVMAQGRVQDKLSEAVEKIQEMNANLCKMISLHELKHDNTERYQAAIDDDVKELNTRIDVLYSTKQKPFEQQAETPEVHHTLKELEKWKWIIVGAVFMLGYMLAHIKWEVLGTFFK